MKRNWRSHYITLVANLIVVIATAINFAVFSLRETTIIYVILIAPFLAALFSCLLYYFDIKYFFADYPYKKFHFKKKWTKFYILGVCVFGIELLAILIFMIVGSYNYMDAINQPDVNSLIVNQATNLLAYLLWASFGVGCVLGLVATGFIKYSRFKIDVELLARKNGKNVADDLDKKGKLVVDDKAVIISFDEVDNNKKGHSKPDPENEKKPETPSAGLSSI